MNKMRITRLISVRHTAKRVEFKNLVETWSTETERHWQIHLMLGKKLANIRIKIKLPREVMNKRISSNHKKMPHRCLLWRIKDDT
jgi:hypothetical protein